jgi:hypothetical protein
MTVSARTPAPSLAARVPLRRRELDHPEKAAGAALTQLPEHLTESVAPAIQRDSMHIFPPSDSGHGPRRDRLTAVPPISPAGDRRKPTVR